MGGRPDFEGREAGLVRPAVVVTADRVLAGGPAVVQVVPLGQTIRGYASEVTIEPNEANGLAAPSSAQCQHVRAVATTRILHGVGNVGSVALAQVRETIAVLLDL